MKTIIHNIAILFLEDGRELQEGLIVIEEDTFRYVGPPIELEGVENARYIDGEGAIAMPGFVNTHTHAPMSLLRGLGDDLPLGRWLSEAIFPVEERMGPTMFYWGGMLAAAEMIAGGTVGFLDMYMGIDAAARMVERSGLRGVVSRAMACTSEDRKEVDETIGAALSFMDEWKDNIGGRLGFSMAPHAEYTCSPLFLSRCGEEARKRNILFQTHISETVDEHMQCLQRHGKTPVALMEDLGIWENRAVAAHCVHVEEGDMAILAKHGVAVAHCPKSNLKLGSGVAPVLPMVRQGIPVTMGTDGAASNNTLNMLEDTRLFALLQKGMTQDAAVFPAEKALSMATLDGRKALGLPDGRLIPGNKADLILMGRKAPHAFSAGESLASAVLYAGQASDVQMTMVDGRVLYHKGQFMTLDEGRLWEEARRCVDTLLYREERTALTLES